MQRNVVRASSLLTIITITNIIIVVVTAVVVGITVVIVLLRIGVDGGADLGVRRGLKIPDRNVLAVEADETEHSIRRQH